MLVSATARIPLVTMTISSQLHLLLLWRGRMNACAHSPSRATQPPSNRMGVRGAISDNSETEYVRLYKQSVFCAGGGARSSRPTEAARRPFAAWPFRTSPDKLVHEVRARPKSAKCFRDRPICVNNALVLTGWP